MPMVPPMAAPQGSHRTQDRGFTALVAAHPLDTFATFAPDLIAARGAPTSVVPLGRQVEMPDLRPDNDHIDAALLATWPDGSQVLLTARWSRIRDIDWPRLAFCVCALKVRHPKADVLAVMLVADRSDADVPQLWHLNERSPSALTLAVRVIRPNAADVPRYRDMNNRIAAALIAVAIRERVDAAVSAARAFVKAPGSSDEARQFLPFLEEFANLKPADRVIYLHLLRKEPSMSIIEEWLAAQASEAQAKGRAEGKAEGRAEGQVALLQDLVARKVLSIADARLEIERLVMTGAITHAQCDAAAMG